MAIRNIEEAEAIITGSSAYPNIRGYAEFEKKGNATAVAIAVTGLPYSSNPCEQGIFAVHIHEGGSCGGRGQDYFSDTKGHYNPTGCPHPYHSGDMPPLFAMGGEAVLTFMTDRFTPEEIVGRTIVIHRAADDFHSQPSGNSGEKIACGVIRAERDD